MTDARELGVLFADISGTTRLYRKIGTNEAHYALDRCIKRMERAIAAHRGRLVMPAVDEMIAVFEGADTAVQAGIEMQKRLADLPPVSGVKLSIRVGVHFGRGVEGDEGLTGAVVDIGRQLLAMAGAGQLLTCAQTAEALSKPLRQLLWTVDDLLLHTAGGECQVFRVRWHDDEAADATFAGRPAAGAIAPPPPPLAADGAAAAPRPPTFCLRYAGKAFLLDDQTPTLIIGRDRKADICIKDPKASRQHAMIVRRDAQHVFLIDSSTNGTYVLRGEQEIHVQGGELRLTGKGAIAFGHSPKDKDVEVAQFEHG